MPLRKGGGRKAVGRNVRELHTGKTYARTKRKYGATKANKQAIAIAMRTAGVRKRRSR